MEIFIKRFDELNLGELYRILAARAEIFVVEQNCAYNDIDGMDAPAVHVWIEEEGEIAAYSRVLDKGAVIAGVKMDEVSIGRVITPKRGQGYGKKIMEIAREVAKKEFGAKKIEIKAQVQAIGFYEKCGYKVSGEEFLEDGILHRKMSLVV